MRARTPDFETTSAQSLDTLRGCIGLYWRGTSVPIPNGTSFQSNFTMPVQESDMILEVTEEGTQRRAKLYYRSIGGARFGKDKILAQLNQCLAPAN